MSKRKDIISGGKADNSSTQEFSKKELEMGIKIEMEHTKDEKIAREIAMDHLKEIPDYYTRLKKMEKEAKMKKSVSELIQDLQKSTIANKDTKTYTDLESVALAKLSTPKEYVEYLKTRLDPLEPGVPSSLKLENEKELRLYKVEDGVFSGTIHGSDGTILHNIDQLSIPEVVSTLGVKEADLPIQTEDNTKIDSKQPIVININISKSKETLMNTLDEKIKTLYKSEEAGGSVEGDIESQDDGKEEGEHGTFKDGKKVNLVTDIIQLLERHHIDGSDENVKDLAKFLVHLHKKVGEEDPNADLNPDQTQVVPGKAPAAKPGIPMKKSVTDLITDLKKGEQAKRTNEELKLIFDKELDGMIRSEYCYMKDRCKDPSKLKEKLAKKVLDRVVSRMAYDDAFLLGKRAVKFDEKYLKEKINKTDFEELDAEMNKQSEPMYLSKEYKLCGERKIPNSHILETLERGNNFFGKDIQKMEKSVQFKEFDYESLAKGKIEKRTDTLIKSSIEEKFRK